MADGDRDRQRSRVEHLLVGREEAIARQHLRVAVSLAVGQALFTLVVWVLVERYGLAEQNLLAFAATVVIAGLVAAVANGVRNGGLLVSVALAVAPLVGAVPVTVIRTGGLDEALVATALMVGGLGVWAGVLGFGLGVGAQLLGARIVERRRRA